MILEGCLGGHDGKGFWNNVEPGSSWAKSRDVFAVKE